MSGFDPNFSPFECLACGKELFGRRDKKYCNDTCRNSGNRKRKGTESWYEPLFITQINAILKRNYKLLKTEVTKHNGPTSVGRFYLISTRHSILNITPACLLLKQEPITLSMIMVGVNSKMER